MRTIEVSDEDYARLERATRQRETSVEEYVDSIVEEEDQSWLSSPEFIAEQDRILEEMNQPGGSLTVEDVWASLEAHKAARQAKVS